MIYKLLNKWLKDRVTAFNTTLTEDSKPLKEVDTTLDSGLLPSNYKDYGYMIKFSDAPDMIGSNFDVNVKLEFYFLLAKKPLSNYQLMIDKYLYALVKYLTDPVLAALPFSDNSISTSIKIIDIGNFSLKDLDKMPELYFMPYLNFTVKFFSNN